MESIAKLKRGFLLVVAIRLPYLHLLFVLKILRLFGGSAALHEYSECSIWELNYP